MDTFDCISKRACVRRYLNKPVDKAILEKLVDAGRRAPTARAVEPWEFVVVTDPGILKKLGEIAENGPFIAESAFCIAIFCRDTKYYLEDGCAATENVLLAATDLGLGACWVAGDKKPYARQVANILKAPLDKKLISLIAGGWPEVEHEQIKSRSLNDVIHWDGF